MLLTGTQRKEELGNRLTYLGLSFPLNGFFYLVMAIAIDSRAEDEEYELNLLAAKNGVEKILSSEFKSISFQDGGDRLIVLAWHERQDMIFRDSLLEAEEINRKLPAYLTASVTLGIGEPVPDVSLIPRSYSDAMKALSFGTIQGGGRIVTYRELIGKTNDARKVPLNWGKLIANALRSSSRDEVFSHIDNLIASYREGYFSVEEYHVSLQMTLAAILQAVEDFDIPQHDIIPAGTDPFSEVRSKTSLEEVREWFISICGRIMDSLKTRQEDFSKAKIREAKAYIETQFSDPSLSLQTVCKELSISTSYFSLIFKKYLKKTFVEYLTETRVEKAKEFLRNTNMKTYDIARSIGYRDAHYFSLIFRKATGEPPTAYRTKSRDESA
jgi:two-component system response regulator YesN